MKERLIKVTLVILAAVGLISINVACDPVTPPKVSPTPPVARPICREEAGDQTPKVMEFAWTYPAQLTPPKPGCQPATGTLQIDVWISIGRNTAGVLSMLCSSLGGIQQGPTSLHAVWFVCMDVRRSALGIPG